jgi:hypothetical protein
MPVSASRTSSILNGLMIALMSFIRCSLRGRLADRQDADRLITDSRLSFHAKAENRLPHGHSVINP